MKTKQILRNLFILILFFSFNPLAAAQVFKTPYFNIKLDSSVKETKIPLPPYPKDPSIQVKMYVYNGSYQRVKFNLTVLVTPLSKEGARNPDKAQRDSLGGAVSGIYKKYNLPPIFELPRTMLVKNTKFLYYTVFEEPDNIFKIYNAIKGSTVYNFFLSVYFEEEKPSNANLKNVQAAYTSLLSAMKEIEFIS